MSMRSLVTAVSLLLAPHLACAQQPILLKLSQFLGPSSFFQQDFAIPWARELEARSNGRVRVELYDGTTPLGGVLNQASQVRDGTVDIALGLRGAEGDKFPRTSLIEAPFLVKDALSGSRALWTLFKQGAFGPEFADYKVLALFVQNPGIVHTISKPVTLLSDLQGVRLRAPNQAVAGALQAVGAKPVILQVNDVMPAVRDGRIDGIVTNWGNPLPDFNQAMHFHTEVPFYTAVFFVVMNKERFAALPADVQAAIEAQSGDVLVDRFGHLWDKWDAPVRDGAVGPDQTIIVPDAAAQAGWRRGLEPVTDQYIAGLEKAGFSDARTVFGQLQTMLPHADAAPPESAGRIAPTGTLRVGLYRGSPSSIIEDASGDPKGVGLDLGRALAARLGIPVQPLVFASNELVLAAAAAGDVDVVFTNRTEAREKLLDFSTAFMDVEKSVLVPAGSPLTQLSDLTRPGLRVGVSRGSSTAGELAPIYPNLSVEPVATLQLAGDMLGAHKLDAFATNDAILYQLSDGVPGSRVLPGHWGIEHFGAAIPKARQQALPVLQAFMDAAAADGTVARAIARSGLRGALPAGSEAR